jgi:hypothetical protein
MLDTESPHRRVGITVFRFGRFAQSASVTDVEVRPDGALLRQNRHLIPILVYESNRTQIASWERGDVAFPVPNRPQVPGFAGCGTGSMLQRRQRSIFRKRFIYQGPIWPCLVQCFTALPGGCLSESRANPALQSSNPRRVFGQGRKGLPYGREWHSMPVSRLTISRHSRFRSEPCENTQIDVAGR